MPDIPQLVAAIDGRLGEIAAEMSALGAAKAELAGPRAASHTPGVAVDAIANRAPRRAARRGVTPPSLQPERALRRRVSERVEASRDGGGAGTPQRSARRRTAVVRASRSRASAVHAEIVERLLADIPAGLSANAVAKEAGAAYSGTLKLLHELEVAGRIRRTGTRRSTMWQLITDEDRIAQRAAELERLRSTPNRRRAKASAS
jgi:hypothetical protein